jgi:glycogen operon protein
VEHERRRLTLNQLIQQGRKTWHGVKVGQPDWSIDSHSLAFEAELREEKIRAYIILNAFWEALEFELPTVVEGSAWRRWVDTSLASPHDIVPWRIAPELTGIAYRTAARSVVMLFEDIGGAQAEVA